MKILKIVGSKLKFMIFIFSFLIPLISFFLNINNLFSCFYNSFLLRSSLKSLIKKNLNGI